MFTISFCKEIEKIMKLTPRIDHEGIGYIRTIQLYKKFEPTQL